MNGNLYNRCYEKISILGILDFRHVSFDSKMLMTYSSMKNEDINMTVIQKLLKDYMIF